MSEKNLIEKNLPCGVNIVIDRFLYGFVIKLRDPKNSTWWSTSPCSDNPDARLTLVIREENLPIIREILDEIFPKPIRTFGNRFRDAWRILRGA